MKRKNRTRTEVLLDIKTQADVKKILKTYKGAAEICIRYFGLGAGVCSLLYGAVHRPLNVWQWNWEFFSLQQASSFRWHWRSVQKKH